MSHLSREEHRTWASSSRLATTKHKGKTEEKAGGNVYSIFSQKTQLKAVRGHRAGAAGVGEPWEGRGRREGAGSMESLF